MTTYNYTKSPADVGRLQQEIKNSTITIVCDSVAIFGSSIDIVFKADLSAGELITLQGIIDTHTDEPLPIEARKVILDEKKNSDGIVSFQPRKSYSDSSKSFTTPDYSSRTRWWWDTVLVTGEVLTADGTYSIYTTTRAEYQTGWGASWINWKRIPNNARQVKPQLKAKIYVNGVLQSTGYTLNCDTGVVTFASPLLNTDVVTADYSYAISSNFELTPTAGKKLMVDYVETQFSTGCSLPSEGCYIIFQAIYNGPALAPDSLYAGFPGYPANTDLPIRTYEYHSAVDFMNESTKAYVCEPFMELTKKLNVLPWDYLTGHTLKPAGDPTTNIFNNEFNKLVCRMVGDGLISDCEIATGSFYCKIEDL